jgi:ribosomal biogenesis protein LAS1
MKRKRTFPEDKFWPPTNSVSLWSPLLRHIQMLHIGFAHTMCARIISILLPEHVAAVPTSSHLNDETLPSAEIEHDPSYYMCLARWVMWSIDNWSDTGVESEMDVRRDVTEYLMQALGHCLRDPRPCGDAAYVQSILNSVWSAQTSVFQRRSSSSSYLLSGVMVCFCHKLRDRVSGSSAKGKVS